MLADSFAVLITVIKLPVPPVVDITVNESVDVCVILVVYAVGINCIF
jgi:hypothetical protein